MKRKTSLYIFACGLIALVALSARSTAVSPPSLDEPNHEVWIIDQSNTRDDDGNGTLDSGGTLYVYQGEIGVERAYPHGLKVLKRN